MTLSTRNAPLFGAAYNTPKLTKSQFSQLKAKAKADERLASVEIIDRKKDTLILTATEAANYRFAQSVKRMRNTSPERLAQKALDFKPGRGALYTAAQTHRVIQGRDSGYTISMWGNDTLVLELLQDFAEEQGLSADKVALDVEG